MLKGFSGPTFGWCGYTLSLSSFSNDVMFSFFFCMSRIFKMCIMDTGDDTLYRFCIFFSSPEEY